MMKMLVAAAAASVIATGGARATEEGQTAARRVTRIGTYDSRAIAVASAGSELCSGEVKAMVAEQDKARAAGDLTRVAELEARGQAHQKLLHMQGFSTAPVDDILAKIKDKLPGIAADANVSAIVSKWDKAALAKHGAAERVDVTMALVDALKPNERQRRYAIEIQKQPPLSLKEAEGVKD